MSEPAGTVVDARGLKCPLPRMKLELALRRLEPGAVVLLLADDPESPLDIAAWCSDRGHVLEEEHERNGVWEFRVRKHK